MEVGTLAIIMTSILSVGIFGNVNIILATVRTKHLQTKIHILVAIMAALDLIAIGFELSSAMRMFFHTESMSRQRCFRFLWVYLFVYDTQMAVGLLIAIDRLVAVTCPLSYNRLSSKWTILVLFAGTVIGAVPVAISYFFLADDILPVCNPPLVVPKCVYFYWNGLSALLALTIITVYLCVFVLMHRLEKTRDNLKQLQITKTLASTIIAYASTKLTAVLMTFTSPLFIANENLINIINTYCVLLVSLEYSINYWLLLLRKDDTYRKPFLQQLCLGRLRVLKTTVNVHLVQSLWKPEGVATRTV